MTIISWNKGSVKRMKKVEEFDNQAYRKVKEYFTDLYDNHNLEMIIQLLLARDDRTRSAYLVKVKLDNSKFLVIVEKDENHEPEVTKIEEMECYSA